MARLHDRAPVVAVMLHGARLVSMRGNVLHAVNADDLGHVEIVRLANRIVKACGNDNRGYDLI